MQDAVEGYLRDRKSVGGVGGDLVAVDDVVTADLGQDQILGQRHAGLGRAAVALLVEVDKEVAQTLSMIIQAFGTDPVGVSVGRHCVEP